MEMYSLVVIEIIARYRQVLSWRRSDAFHSRDTTLGKRQGDPDLWFYVILYKQIMTQLSLLRDRLGVIDDACSLAQPLAWKRVEERFERVGLVCELEVSGGRRIGTTAEHPFYVAGKGWRAAGELQPGDRILGLGPQEGVAVVAVRATGRWVPLYNLRIADYHTYFVGDRDWEGAVWAHNASYGEHAQILRRNLIKAGEKEAKYAAHLVPTGDWSRRGVGDMVRQMQQWLNEARIGLDIPVMAFSPIPHAIWVRTRIGTSNMHSRN
jgi:hypothetical protein